MVRDGHLRKIRVGETIGDVSFGVADALLADFECRPLRIATDGRTARTTGMIAIVARLPWLSARRTVKYYAAKWSFRLWQDRFKGCGIRMNT